MKKFAMRRLILICVVCVLLAAFGTITFAQGIQRQINVALLPLRFIIAGIDRTPPDGMIDTGVSRVPAGFIFQGTTYVPLRFISDALDKDVIWEGATRTIFIGPRGQAIADTPLMEIPLWSGPLASVRGNWQVNRARSALETGMRTFSNNPDIQSMSFNLNSLATRVSGSFYIRRDGWTRPRILAGVILTILGDGKALFTSGVLMDGGDPISFIVDTHGILQLTLRVEAPTSVNASPIPSAGIVGISNLNALTTDY